MTIHREKQIKKRKINYKCTILVSNRTGEDEKRKHLDFSPPKPFFISSEISLFSFHLLFERDSQREGERDYHTEREREIGREYLESRKRGRESLSHRKREREREYLESKTLESPNLHSRSHIFCRG